jgi:hypothetical protein
MKTKKRIVVRHNNTVQIFTLGKTTNKKIALPDEKIVQTYTYSKSQYEYVLNNEKVDFKTFFKLADTNCLDCIFSMLQNSGCYTHKFNQYTGFLSQLRSIGKIYGNYDNLPIYNDNIEYDITTLCKDRFIRFGTYGEPCLIPYNLVWYMTQISKTWTGYSHQWMKKEFNQYSKFFMASTHNIQQSIKAETMPYNSWRSFQVVNNKPQFTSLVNCPASKEAGFISNCAKCGLCSGTTGKGNKSIYIFKH